jgi:uncharacterized protein (DUF849 family)
MSEDKSKSSVPGGYRETTHRADGSSKDVTVNSTTGNVVDITEHNADGSSKSYEPLHYPWGYSKGPEKK